jgi:L-ascorbate metabolism protein UlaG (beta-lactamase superfamily)
MAALNAMDATTDMDRFLSRWRWLGRSALLFQDGLTVYVDPVGVPADAPKADVVFLTHPCDDHCLEKDVDAVATPATVVAGPRDCVSKFRLNQMPMRPGEARDVLGMKVSPVAAYNTREGSHHAKDNGWLGYFIEFPGAGSIYYPGASSFVPEMRGLRPDVLFFPVAVHDGLTDGEVAPFLEELKPKLVIPIHHDAQRDGPALERLLGACRRLGIACGAGRGGGEGLRRP